MDLLQSFIKMFWNTIGHGALTVTQKQGIITCIPKENKPRKFVKNLRHLTLLNAVYKLASGTIANRLKSVLDHLISNN